MTTTNFIDKQTVIVADWLNDVDAHIYNQDLDPHDQYRLKSDLLANNGSSLVQYNEHRTVQEKLGEIVSVKDFGAVGDGVTDDTAALVRLISSVPDGCIVKVQGDFLITSTVTIDKALRFISSGKGYQGGRFLNLTDTTLTMFLVNAHGVEFDSVEIRGAGNTGTSKGIVVGDGVTNKDSFTLNSAYISYFNIGVEIKTQNWAIRNGTIVSTCGTGLLMTGLPSATERRNCYISDSYFHSCGVGVNAPNVWHSVGITNNDFGSCVDGISGGFARSQIKDNNLPNCTGTEINVTSAGSSTNLGLHVTGNIVYPGASQGAGKSGIVVTGDYAHVTHNTIVGKSGHGISIIGSNTEVLGNIVRDNDANDTTTYDGIIVVGNANNIQNNLARTTTGGASKQRYGINVSSGSGNIVKNNKVDANKSAQIKDSGSSTVIKHNTGFVTEAKGAASVLVGTTSIVVTHGLAITPPAGSIQLTPMYSHTNVAYWWISSVNATTFTITCDVDPGIQNQSFGWQIII